MKPDAIELQCRRYAALVREWDAFEPGKPGPPQEINYQAEARAFDEAAAEIERLRTALQGVVSDVLEYEKVNNLAPNPGRRYCWDSVARAMVVLGNEQNRDEK